MDLFKSLFGGKPWYESVTAWGLVLAGAVTAAFANGLIPEKYAMVGAVASYIVTQLGIRRAATSKNVS